MKTTPRIAALLAASCILNNAGCRTAVPDAVEETGLETPPAYAARLPEEHAVQASWIGELGGEPLEALVAEALDHNRDLTAAAARVRQAAAQARIARAQRWPELGGSFSGSRSRSVIVNPLPPETVGAGGPELPELLQTTVTRFDLAAELSWEADLWGRLGDSARAAAASHEAALRDFDGARLALAGEVTRRWLEYVEASHHLNLAQRTEANFRTHEQIITRRFEAGLSSALDLRLARTSTRSAAAQVIARQQQQDALARALEVLLGRYPDRSLAMAADWPPVGSPPKAGVPAELVQRRPDLRAAEARYAAAVLERGATRKLRYPRLTLTGSAGTASTELSDLLDSDFGVWSLVGGITAPLFTAGRISAQIEAAKAGEVAALEDFASALLNAYREVETALAAEQFLSQQEVRIAELAEETLQAETQAWEQYERGLVGIATALEAQRRAFESSNQLITAQAQRRLNRVALYLSLGGGLFNAAPDNLLTPQQP